MEYLHVFIHHQKMAELKLEKQYTSHPLWVMFQSLTFIQSFIIISDNTLSCSFFFMLYCTDVHFYTHTQLHYICIWLWTYNMLGSHMRDNLQLFFLRFWRLEITFQQQCSHGFWSGQKRKCLLQMPIGKWVKTYTVSLEGNWTRRCGSALERKDLTQLGKNLMRISQVFCKNW